MPKILIIYCFSFLWFLSAVAFAEDKSFGILSVENGLSIHKEQSLSPRDDKEEPDSTAKFNAVLPKVMGSAAASDWSANLEAKVKKDYDEFFAVIKEKPPYYFRYTFDVDYTLYSGTVLPFLSIAVGFDSYLGGAHGNYLLRTTTFNTENGLILRLSDIFTTEGLAFIINDINQQIKQDTEEQFFKDAEVVNLDNVDFYFDGNQIVFIFQRYDISPYSSGMPSFSYDVRRLQEQLFFIK
ncbi:MAG: RsiV family protein [Alphaproteobacteria bacterium]|jgi:hypothetical protein|nr:RsiV family protein [Alphaproteobacteria bacterium]